MLFVRDQALPMALRLQTSGGEQRFLPREVAIDGGFRDTGMLGDFRRRRPAETLRRKQLQRSANQTRAGGSGITSTRRRGVASV
jgi:hypothetical protein